MTNLLGGFSIRPDSHTVHLTSEAASHDIVHNIHRPHIIHLQEPLSGLHGW